MTKRLSPERIADEDIRCTVCNRLLHHPHPCGRRLTAEQLALHRRRSQSSPAHSIRRQLLGHIDAIEAEREEQEQRWKTAHGQVATELAEAKAEIARLTAMVDQQNGQLTAVAENEVAMSKEIARLNALLDAVGKHL